MIRKGNASEVKDAGKRKKKTKARPVLNQRTTQQVNRWMPRKSRRHKSFRDSHMHSKPKSCSVSLMHKIGKVFGVSSEAQRTVGTYL